MTIISNRKVARIKTNIKAIRGFLVDPIRNSRNHHRKNCMANSEENYEWNLEINQKRNKRKFFPCGNQIWILDLWINRCVLLWGHAVNSANAFKKIVSESVKKLTKKLTLKNQEFFLLILHLYFLWPVRSRCPTGNVTSLIQVLVIAMLIYFKHTNTINKSTWDICLIWLLHCL